jgi:hypothetical protein
MKGGGQEDVVAVLAGILAKAPEDKDIKETLDATLAAVIGSIATGKPLANALTPTAGEETAKQTATQTSAEGSTESSVTEDYDTKVLSPNEEKLRVRVFLEDKDPENKDSPNNKKILAFLNPKPDTFKFDELKLFQKLLFTQPDILTYLRSINPHEFIKFWRTYVEHDGTSVITLHTTQAGKQIKSFLNRLHNSRLTYSLYKVKELLRPYEAKKMEEEYGEIKPPFTIADSAKKFTEIFLPEKRTPEVSASGSPPPSIQQDYKDPQQKENIEKLSKSIEKLKDARKDSVILGDTITKPDTQLGPYSIFKTTYEGLEASVKEISDIKNNFDNKVAELNAYAEKKSKEKTTPIEQIALRAVIDTHNKIKGEYEKYIVELVAKIKEAGELLTAEKETYDKVSKALQNVTKGKKEPATPPPVKKAKEKTEEEEEEEGGEEEEEGGEESKEEKKTPGELRMIKATDITSGSTLENNDHIMQFIRYQLTEINKEKDTTLLGSKVMTNILEKLFKDKKWKPNECKKYDEGACVTSFRSFISNSNKRNPPTTIEELLTKINRSSTRTSLKLNSILYNLLYDLDIYNKEQKTQIHDILDMFENETGLWKEYIPKKPKKKGGYRRRTPDHKKPGKRVTRRH